MNSEIQAILLYKPFSIESLSLDCFLWLEPSVTSRPGMEAESQLMNCLTFGPIIISDNFILDSDSCLNWHGELSYSAGSFCSVISLFHCVHWIGLLLLFVVPGCLPPLPSLPLRAPSVPIAICCIFFSKLFSSPTKEKRDSHFLWPLPSKLWNSCLTPNQYFALWITLTFYPHTGVFIYTWSLVSTFLHISRSPLGKIVSSNLYLEAIQERSGRSNVKKKKREKERKLIISKLWAFWCCSPGKLAESAWLCSRPVGAKLWEGGVQGMWHIRGEITQVENLASMDFRIHYTDFPLTRCLECLWGVGKPKRRPGMTTLWERKKRSPAREGCGLLALADNPLCLPPTTHHPPRALLGSPGPRLLITGWPVGQDSGRSASTHPSVVASLPLKWPLTAKDIYKGKNNMMI